MIALVTVLAVALATTLVAYRRERAKATAAQQRQMELLVALDRADVPLPKAGAQFCAPETEAGER